MTEKRTPEKAAKKGIKPQPSAPNAVDRAVGLALHNARIQANFTIRALADAAGVSPAMISRIENAQVSPSLSTLSALSHAIGVPLANLFRYTLDSADITHVQAGKGLSAERIGHSFHHHFELLGYHKRQDMRFEPYLITLEDDSEMALDPLYHDQGCEFLYLLEGEMHYRYGERTYHLKAGDSLSFDAINSHGVERVISAPVRFLMVAAHML